MWHITSGTIQTATTLCCRSAQHWLWLLLSWEPTSLGFFCCFFFGCCPYKNCTSMMANKMCDYNHRTGNDMPLLRLAKRGYSGKWWQSRLCSTLLELKSFKWQNIYIFFSFFKFYFIFLIQYNVEGLHNYSSYNKMATVCLTEYQVLWYF